MLYEEGFEESQLTKQVLPRLGLKPSRKITLDLLKLAEIFDLEERACLENYTAEDLLPLMKFSGAEIRLLVRHLKDIELGGNKWKSLLQLIREVSRLRGLDIGTYDGIPGDCSYSPRGAHAVARAFSYAQTKTGILAFPGIDRFSKRI